MQEAFPHHDDLPFFEKLRLLFKIMAGFELEHPKLASIGNKAVSGKAPLPADLVIRGKQDTISYFADLITFGKAKGEINPEVNAEIAAFVFVSALSEIGNYVSNKQTGTEPSADRMPPALQFDQMEKLYQQMIEIFKNGIAC